MEERLRLLELTVARMETELKAFMRETREHRARRNGNHWREKGGIALGGGGLGAGALAGLQALIERLAG